MKVPCLDTHSFYSFYLKMQSYGNKTAFLSDSGSLSYCQFVDDICRVSQVFSERDQRVRFELQDKYNFAVAFFATVLSGNTACLLPFGKGAKEIEVPLACDMCLTDDILIKARDNKVSELNFRHSAEIAVIICSSGTTMSNKAVALSEENILSDLLAGIETFEYGCDDVMVNILPYTHVFGLICDLCVPLYCGCQLSFSYDLGEFLSLLPKRQPTVLHLAPGIVELLLKLLQQAENQVAVVGDRLKRIMSGGSFTTVELCLAMRQYQIEVFGSYGLTECSCGVCVCSRKNNRVGSAGRPLSCNRIEIDNDGKISVIGNNVMLGYIGGEGELQPLIGQKFETGDLGYFDEDGFLFITGRADDLILFSDGKKIMPQKVERILNELPGVVESLVYKTENDRIEAIVIVDKIAQSEKLKEQIYKLDIDGHKINSLIFSKEPLQKTDSGKLKRSFYEKRRT